MKHETAASQVKRMQEAGLRWRGYPCTIIKDRYGGSYSRAAWTAWPCDPDDLPLGPLDEDPECEKFWHTLRRQKALVLVGLGSTPDEAKADLYKTAELLADAPARHE